MSENKQDYINQSPDMFLKDLEIENKTLENEIQ